ncbi:hypothetical protein PLANPX_0392 [Lacipirellula parvula]|uniref:Uncharacterized protein n=1 Tax=Lacipirellula parvula TaxID=2650471 RepID=A0A5K7X2T6_9BACT|nr:hypothetical protein PLANPX_0392 [Lacipirellula parvula]
MDILAQRSSITESPLGVCIVLGVMGVLYFLRWRWRQLTQQSPFPVFRLLSTLLLMVATVIGFAYAVRWLGAQSPDAPSQHSESAALP